MAGPQVHGVIEYSQIGEIRLKSGLLSSKLRDPSEDLESEIRAFVDKQRAAFNSRVENTFELEDGQFTKFEFLWTPQRARRIYNQADLIGKAKIVFRSEADVTLLYLKERSLIIFETFYKIAVTEPGCGGTGRIYYSGGRNYKLEEIYFNKITTVGAYHDEELYDVVNPSCWGENRAKHTISKDGFVIRAGEAFRILASKQHAQELKAARSMINQKISGSN